MIKKIEVDPKEMWRLTEALSEVRGRIVERAIQIEILIDVILTNHFILKKYHKDLEHL